MERNKEHLMECEERLESLKIKLNNGIKYKTLQKYAKIICPNCQSEEIIAENTYCKICGFKVFTRPFTRKDFILIARKTNTIARKTNTIAKIIKY